MGRKKLGVEPVVIDERWMPDWVDFGLGECAAFLEKRAQFEEYCRARDEEAKG